MIKFSELSDDDLASYLHTTFTVLQEAGEYSALAAANRLREAGAVSGIYVGKSNLSRRETLEWYAGQFLDIVDNNSWFAMNSFLNAADKFAK